MTTRFRLATMLLATTLAGAAIAHDPSQHKDQSGAKPDCAAMKNMDPAKMDPKDPVMQALHKKCEAAAHSDDHAHDQVPATTTTPPKQPDEHGGH